MAVDGLVETLKSRWLSRRESLDREHVMLKQGDLRTFEDRGAGQVETTSRSLQRVEDEIANLDEALALLLNDSEGSSHP